MATTEKTNELIWYALLVSPQKEYVAAHIIGQRFGAETFVPSQTKWRKRNRYSKQKEEFTFPVLPRFVFAGFERQPPWLRLFGIPLVHGVVGFGDRPVALNRYKVEEFMRGQVNGSLVIDGIKRQARAETSTAMNEERYMRSREEFKEGDDVLIVDGPFRQSMVKVHQIKGHTAKVLLPLFGGDTEVSVDLWQLASVA